MKRVRINWGLVCGVLLALVGIGFVVMSIIGFCS